LSLKIESGADEQGLKGGNYYYCSYFFWAKSRSFQVAAFKN